MTSHQLARALLERPDLPVVVNDEVDYDDTQLCEVVVAQAPSDESFNGATDTAETPRGDRDEPVPRPCIQLLCCTKAPVSLEEAARVAEAQAQAKARFDESLRTDPVGHALRYVEIKPLTPDDMVADLLDRTEDQKIG